MKGSQSLTCRIAGTCILSVILCYKNKVNFGKMLPRVAITQPALKLFTRKIILKSCKYLSILGNNRRLSIVLAEFVIKQMTTLKEQPCCKLSSVTYVAKVIENGPEETRQIDSCPDNINILLRSCTEPAIPIYQPAR